MGPPEDPAYEQVTVLGGVRLSREHQAAFGCGDGAA
jgi:hypothetical protein